MPPHQPLLLFVSFERPASPTIAVAFMPPCTPSFYACTVAGSTAAMMDTITEGTIFITPSRQNNEQATYQMKGVARAASAKALTRSPATGI
jgi:hypothetical protein